jgi:hypothetical protein
MSRSREAGVSAVLLARAVLAYASLLAPVL